MSCWCRTFALFRFRLCFSRINFCVCVVLLFKPFVWRCFSMRLYENACYFLQRRTTTDCEYTIHGVSIRSMETQTAHGCLYRCYRIFWCVVWLPPHSTNVVYIRNKRQPQQQHNNICHCMRHRFVCMRASERACMCASVSVQKEHGCISDPSSIVNLCGVL